MEVEKYIGRLMRKLFFVILLLTVPVSLTSTSASSSVNPPAKSAPAEIQEPFTLLGVVKDLSGNPVQASIYVTDRQNNALANLLTDTNGAYTVTIPVREEMVVMASPQGLAENLITMTDGHQISKYFELTKGIFPASDSVKVDFAFPPSAALWLEAYDPSGALMNYDAVNEAINPSGFYGYGGAYGIFPLASMDLPVPDQPSIGMFRWAWPPNNDRNLWEPCFRTPPGEPVFIMMLWEVPGIGTFPLRADNQGLGYNLNDGEARKINLVYEFAETEHRRTVELRTRLEAQGYVFSSGLLDVLNQANTALNQARSQSDDQARALSSYAVLKLSIQAREQMTIEAAGVDIPKRMNDLKIVVHDQAGNPVPGANVSYRQEKLDFIMTAGIGAPANPFPYPGYRAGIDMGLQSLTELLRWNEVSPQQGVFDFSAADSEYQQIQDMGYDITVYLAWLGSDNVPAWAASMNFADFQQQVGLFVKAAVEHFTGKVKYMIVATEMNLQAYAGSRYVSISYQSSYLTGVQPAELIELIRAAFQGGREAHSNMLLGYYGIPDYNYNSLNPLPMGGWPVSYTFLKSMLESGVQPDYIGIEMYPGTLGIPQDLSNVADILQAYHDLSGLPVMVTETVAYSSRAEDYGETGPAPHVYWHEGFTEAAQAEWETSFYKIALSRPYVLGVQMFQVGGPDNPPQQNGAPLDDCMGIPTCVSRGIDSITQDFQTKQVFYAMQNLIASWKTNGSGVTDAAGGVSLIGLNGTYTIEVTAPNGLVQTFERQLNQETSPVTITLDSPQALQDLQIGLLEAQRKVDWSAELGRLLDYTQLRSYLTNARSTMTSGDYASARNLINLVLDATAITIDGSPDDWQGIAPILTTPSGGGTVNAAGIDLKVLYGIQDDQFLYLLVEVYDPPIVLQPGAVDGSFWYPQFLFNLTNSTGVEYHLRTYLPYHGQINVYRLTDPVHFIGTYYSIAYDQALELKLPLSLIGYPRALQACGFVMAAENNAEKVAKAFDGCAMVLQPLTKIFLPLVAR
jgi:hypothetical protein